MQDRQIIAQAEAFLKEQFEANPYFQANPTQGSYRLEHSYRVANIGAKIARAEGMNELHVILACLLHDLSYAEEFHEKEDWLNHGRRAAEMARPFLESLGLPPDGIQEICYAIAIHVDDEADIPGERNAFTLTVTDADNIDRYDAYRLYESLQYNRLHEMNLPDKETYVQERMDWLEEHRGVEVGTPTAGRMWQEQIDFQLNYYRKLLSQLQNSKKIF